MRTWRSRETHVPRSAPRAGAREASSDLSLTAAILRLQRVAGNRAIAALARQPRPAPPPAPTRAPAQPAPPAAPPPPATPAAPAVVTRVVIVTTNDSLRVPVQGAGRASIPQQEVWRVTARSLVRREPAPGGGQSVIIEAATYGALEARFRGLAARGARVSRVDFVGHGQPNGFNLSGTQASPDGWVSADDIAGLVSSTGIATGATSFEANFRACFTDPVVPLLAQRLVRAGVPSPVVRGVSGAYQPRYGPPAGQTNIQDRGNWVVDDPGTNVSTDVPAPSVPAAALRGL